MNAILPNSTDAMTQLQHPLDFSLVQGGPLFQLFCRLHLSDDALMLARQRIIIITLITWLPLLLLAALQGQLLGGGVTAPFLLDVDIHIRFLVALPLLIAAEVVVHRRMRTVVKLFLERHLIPDSARAQFDAAIVSAMRWRNSLFAEVLLIVLVYVVGILFIWRHYLVMDISTWYAIPGADGSKLSLAGMWYVYFSLPFFQFLLIRWYFRILIWVRFLWQVSRIKLALVATHPDRVGGLGFLSNTAYAFTLLALAHGSLLAGLLANRILLLGSVLIDYKVEIASIAVFILCLVLGPMLLFAPQLMDAKRKGLQDYGTLAERYVRDFDHKWLRGGAAAEEPLLGSSDIQSLADLNNSVEVVQSMRVAPFTKDTVIQLLAATLAPVIPLLLTMMPLEELLKNLLKVLF
jgi:hypothetical protein